MNSELKGKWVFITGGSSGFGAAAARAFAAQGAHVVVVARRGDRLKAVAAECAEAGAASAHHHVMDVGSTASVNACIGWLRERTGRLDVLVNNAGGAHGVDTVAEGKDEDWEAMVQVNFLGVLRVTRAALPLLADTPGSLILNVGSVAGRAAYEGGSAYCGVKAAALQVTRALRLELCAAAIRVCTLDPGLAETEFALVRYKGDRAKADKVYEGIEPLRAEDIAETMVWMASRPPHVCIDEVVMKCTAQAAVHKVHRRLPAKGKGH